MKLRALLLALTGVVLSAGSVLTWPAEPAGADDAAPVANQTPVRIMLAGDSITQGFDGDFTWRYRLDRELRRQKVTFDFVGPHRYTYGGAAHYAVGTGWDTDHDATGGTRLRTELTNIVADMAYGKPDVLVALYGTTDLLPRTPGAPDPSVTVAAEIADLRTYIQDAREVNGDVDIVLGEITTRRIPNRQAFNDALHTLAAQESQASGYPDSRVLVADLDYPGWSPDKYTYDSTHPNPVGEAVIAQRVASALEELAVVPDDPAIQTAGLRYAPAWQPHLRVSRTGRIVIDWYTTKFLNKPQLLRAWIKDLRTGKSGISAWTRARQYASTTRPPGRYQVRIQGRRQAMVSPWSPVWTVTVHHR